MILGLGIDVCEIARLRRALSGPAGGRFRARREGQGHAMFQHGLRQLEHVVNRGRKASIEKCTCAYRQHQGLARAWPWAPGNQLADIAGFGTWSRRAHEGEN